MKILIVGCGGIGGFLAAKLGENGLAVTVAARGDNGVAISKNGITLESRGRKLHSKPALLNPRNGNKNGDKFGLIFVAVKMFDLAEAVGGVAHLLAEDGLLVPLQNGSDAHQTAAAIVGGGAARCGRGTAHISASLEAPGRVVHHGELAGFFVSPHPLTEQLAARLDGVKGIKLAVRADVENMIWDKFVFLSAFSGVTAMFRLAMGAIRAAPPLWDFYKLAMAEAGAVTEAEVPGRLDAECTDKWLKASQKMPTDYRASMALDLERGRRLELPWLSGRVARLGEKHKIATPCSDLIVASLTEFV